jgi:hypothetical protein
MIRANQSASLLYTIILVLLVVSLFGPWGFTPDGVPPIEYCDERFIILDGTRCVRTLPMTEGLSMFAMGLWSMIGGLFSGKLLWFNQPHAFLTLLYPLSILLPLLSTLLVVWAGQRPKVHLFHLVASVLGAGWGIFLFFGLGKISWEYARLWGVLLYFALTAGMVIFEMAFLNARRKNRENQVVPV